MDSNMVDDAESDLKKFAYHESARAWVHGSQFLEEISQSGPRWIDIENEEVGIAI